MLKKEYRDEYTNDLLPRQLVEQAMREELRWFNKVVWKQGSYAVAMGLKGKKETLIPGYVIQLCTREELVGIHHRIKVEEAKRDDATVHRKT